MSFDGPTSARLEVVERDHPERAPARLVDHQRRTHRVREAPDVALVRLVHLGDARLDVGREPAADHVHRGPPLPDCDFRS
jgi:hypothetical protein